MLDKILKIIYPPKCAICKKEDLKEQNSYICKSCVQKLRLNKLKKYENVKYNFCFNYITKYEVLREVFIKYKFFKNKYLSHTFTSILRQNEEALELFKKVDYVIYVPSSFEKQKQRQFDTLGEIFKVDNLIDNLLIKQNVEISSLTQEDRYKKKDIFKINEKQKNQYDLNNKKILIVDDIITTGTTIANILNVLSKTYKNISCEIFVFAYEDN